MHEVRFNEVDSRKHFVNIIINYHFIIAIQQMIHVLTITGRNKSSEAEFEPRKASKIAAKSSGNDTTPTMPASSADVRQQ